jgi:hypothetical protein
VLFDSGAIAFYEGNNMLSALAKYVINRLTPHVVKSVILKDFEIKFVLNNGRNKFSFSYHVGYDISPLSRVKLKILTTRLTACG